LGTLDKQAMLESLEEELAQVQEQQEELIERETALEQAIDGMRELVSLENVGNIVELEAHDAPVIKRNMFANASIAQAALYYLDLVGESQTNRQIVDALIQGGKKSTAKRFTDTVRSILLREAQRPNSPIYWTGTAWALTNWGPPEADR
jgi:CRISPR/Cas system-associated exonuclease Cas4 (RecB family)